MPKQKNQKPLSVVTSLPVKKALPAKNNSLVNKKTKLKKVKKRKKDISDLSREEKIQIFKDCDLGIVPISEYAILFGLAPDKFLLSLKSDKDLQFALAGYQSKFMKDFKNKYLKVLADCTDKPSQATAIAFQAMDRAYKTLSEKFKEFAYTSNTDKKFHQKQKNKTSNYEELRQKIIDLTPEKMELIPITEEDYIGDVKQIKERDISPKDAKPKVKEEPKRPFKKSDEVPEVY